VLRVDWWETKRVAVMVAHSVAEWVSKRVEHLV
jgi:hypothetical protein